MMLLFSSSFLGTFYGHANPLKRIMTLDCDWFRNDLSFCTTGSEDSQNLLWRKSTDS